MRFGRYELIERLAVGGMAELFRARAGGAEGFEKIVVIKRLLPHMTADPHFNAMFIDEAKITARLAHPKIAQTYELGRHGDQLYIAMEYVDGIDGLALLRESAHRREAIDAGIAVYVVQATLDALDFAHHLQTDDGSLMGIVHRDVSPSNILLSRRGDIKLVDFGIAHTAEQDHRTKAGTLKGKYGYMSPEQVLGEGLDPRSDVFAAGIVLSEFLTGRRLFAAGNELDVLLMVRDARLDRLDRFGAGIEPGLDAILRKALIKDRSQRFASAADFREALDEWMFTQRKRVSPREIAELVASYYDAAQARRREHVASAAEVTTSVHDSGEIDPSSFEIEGIPSGSFKITDSVPVISIEEAAEPRPEVPAGEPEESFELSFEEDEPGAVGRALDELLARTSVARRAEGKSSGRWPTLDLGPAGASDEDAVPEAVADDSAERSVRYPSIEEAVASVSQRKPDPSAIDFDDSEVVPPARKSVRRRLPTVEELKATPLPVPPSLDRIGDTPHKRGDLSLEPPVRVLYRLMSQRDKGLLVVELSGIRKEIYMSDGVPVFVTSNLARELFGEYLVSQGVIAEGELSMALAMMPHYGGKLGDTLVGLGLLKPLEVFRLLTRQVRHKLIDVCTWGKGEYSWFPGRENPRDAFPLDLQPWEVLGAGAMAIPEPVVVKWANAVAGKKPRSQRNRALRIDELQLPDLLRRHYDTLAGNRTVEELSALFTDGEERNRYLRMLYLLFYTDLVELV